MKTENEVKEALTAHQTSMKLPREQIVQIAEKLGWTIDKTRGYMEGVEFAYKWVLSAYDTEQQKILNLHKNRHFRQ